VPNQQAAKAVSLFCLFVCLFAHTHKAFIFWDSIHRYQQIGTSVCIVNGLCVCLCGRFDFHFYSLGRIIAATKMAAMLCGDEVCASVCDLGSSLCRFGIAGQDTPRHIFRTDVGRKKSEFLLYVLINCFHGFSTSFL
jgi:hypothetical protein